MGTTDMQWEIYQAMPPWRRIATACALHDFAHQRLVIHLSRRYPDKPRSEILKIALRRFLRDAARVL